MKSIVAAIIIGIIAGLVATQLILVWAQSQQ